MQILTISGSTRKDSANVQLLEALPKLFPQQEIYNFNQLDQLPLFFAEADQHPWPQAVLDWRKAAADADAFIISTPAYLYNIPALLKNAFEWLTSSGEMNEKPVVAITFTPNSPRGEKAMQSLLWSLQALNARVVVSLPLYQNEVAFDDQTIMIDSPSKDMLLEAIRLLWT